MSIKSIKTVQNVLRRLKSQWAGGVSQDPNSGPAALPPDEAIARMFGVDVEECRDSSFSSCSPASTRSSSAVHHLRLMKTARRVPTKMAQVKIAVAPLEGEGVRTSGLRTRGRQQKLTHKPRVFAPSPHSKSLVSGLQGFENNIAGTTSARHGRTTFSCRINVFFFLHGSRAIRKKHATKRVFPRGRPKVPHESCRYSR